MDTEVEPHIREAIERYRRREADKDAGATVTLDQILLRMTKQFKAVTPEESANWEWEHCIVRELLSLGWDRRHCRRIAPKWNCPDQEQAFRIMNETLKGNGAVVALVGERGVGKTTLAAEHTRVRIEARRAFFEIDEKERPSPHAPPAPARYEKLGRISSMFKPLYADFGSLNGDELKGLLDVWCRRDLVVIDEIHETEDLKTNMRFLADFVDRRYANHKDTILISNHSGEQFRDEMNPSIISRLLHHGCIIDCAWESHRHE